MHRAPGPILLALVLAIALGGCAGTAGMPLPPGSPTPTGGSLPNAADVITPSGSPTFGTLGDPCALLKKSEIEKALGVAVLGVVRGELKPDGGQLCAWAMDAPGSTAAALGGFVGTLSGSDLGTVVDGLGTAGAAFGVLVGPVDSGSRGSGGSGDLSSAPPHPGISIVKVDIGAGGAVIALPNGGAAFASDGTRASLTLMDLIAGPSDSNALKLLLTTAYNRL